MARSVKGTLVPGVVTTVTVQHVADYGIEIIKLTSGDDVIWYRLDGEDPAVFTSGSHPVLGSRKVADPGYNVAPENDAVQVKLICSAAVDFVVEGEPAWAFIQGGGDV